MDMRFWIFQEYPGILCVALSHDIVNNKIKENLMCLKERHLQIEKAKHPYEQKYHNRQKSSARE